MKGAVIRPLKIETFEIHELIMLCFPEFARGKILLEISQGFNRGDAFRPAYYGIFQDKKLIAATAFSLSQLSDFLLEINWMVVHPSYQSQGLGSKLLRFVLREGRAKYPDVTEVIVATNTAGKFYRKFGFSAHGSTDIHIKSFNRKKS